MLWKWCPVCKKKKPEHKFNKDTSKKDKLQSLCKLCSNELNKTWLIENEEERSEYQIIYRRSDQGRKVRAKSRAKRKRQLGWYELRENPFAYSVHIDYHHIDDKHVVALPTWLHQSMHFQSRQTHRDALRWVIEQLYEGIYLEVGENWYE